MCVCVGGGGGGGGRERGRGEVVPSARHNQGHLPSWLEEEAAVIVMFPASEEREREREGAMTERLL